MEAVGDQGGAESVSQPGVGQAELAVDARARQPHGAVPPVARRRQAHQVSIAVDLEAVGGQRGAEVIGQLRVGQVELAADMRAQQPHGVAIPARDLQTVQPEAMPEVQAVRG